jgi:hypothetical protein
VTTTAQSVIQEVQQEILLDLTGNRWSATVLVRHLNDMQRVLVSSRPDVGAASVTLTLIAGHAQVLPATAMGLQRVLANAGGTKGSVRQCQREMLDAIDPNWRNGTQSATIKNVMVDPAHPRRYEVYPPATNTASLEAIVTAYPIDVAAPTAPGLLFSTVTGNISVPDEFKQALVHMVAYYAYLKDAEYASNASLATVHLNAAVAMVGEQLKSQLAALPGSGREETA